MPNRPALIDIGENYNSARIALQAVAMGADLAICLSGGERPHIGAVAVAQPRPSLSDPARISATTSVIALLGHKEDELARHVAGRVAAAANCVVTVACGIHYEKLSAEQIGGIDRLVERLTDRLLQELGSPPGY
jgi:hypothetical protein